MPILQYMLPEDESIGTNFIKKININPHSKYLFKTTNGGFPIYVPEDGLIESKYDGNPTFLFNQSYDYFINLFDKRLIFPAMSPMTVTRSFFQVSQPKSFLYVLIQVSIIVVLCNGFNSLRQKKQRC